MRSRLVAMALLATMVAGCSDGADKATTAPSASGSASASAAAVSGSITVAAAGGEGEIKALNALVDSFKVENPGVAVTVDSVEGAGDLVTKLTTAFAGGTPPDVFLMNYRRLGGLVSQIEPVSGFDTSQIYPSTTSAFTRDGQLLCLPQNASSLVIYVNPKLFAQAGVELPSPDWTWADMLATAKALAAKKVEAVGFDPELIRVAPFVWSAGGEIVDNADAPTKIDLSSPAAKSALQFFLDLQKTGLDATQRAGMSAEDTFAAGKVAMYFDSRRAVPGFRKTEGLEFDVRPIPAGAKGRISVLHSDGYCVTKAAKNKAAAQAFAAYAVGPKGGRVLAEAGRTVPSVKSLAESDAFLTPGKLPASSQAWLDQLPDLRALPPHKSWNGVEGSADDVLGQLFAGKIGLDEAIKEIATVTGAEFAKS